MIDPLEIKKMQVAGSPSGEEIISLLTLLADSVSNINTAMPKEIGMDSFELRKAISAFLLLTVDDVKRMRNNVGNSSGSSSED